MFDRESVLERAVHDCYREMFRKAQPRANYDDYIRKIKNGEIPKDTRIYERHYLPDKEFKYIVNKRYIVIFGPYTTISEIFSPYPIQNTPWIIPTTK